MSYLFIGMFLILFILKLMGYIAVSWWIVTLPLWIGMVLVLVLFFGMIIGALGIAGLSAWFASKLDK